MGECPLVKKNFGELYHSQHEDMQYLCTCEWNEDKADFVGGGGLITALAVAARAAGAVWAGGRPEARGHENADSAATVNAAVEADWNKAAVEAVDGLMMTHAATGGTTSSSRTESADRTQFRKDLTAFYTKFNPEKLGNVDALVAIHGGSKRKREKLTKALQKKYNPTGGDLVTILRQFREPSVFRVIETWLPEPLGGDPAAELALSNPGTVTKATMTSFYRSVTENANYEDLVKNPHMLAAVCDAYLNETIIMLFPVLEASRTAEIQGRKRETVNALLDHIWRYMPREGTTQTYGIDLSNQVSLRDKIQRKVEDIRANPTQLTQGIETDADPVVTIRRLLYNYGTTLLNQKGVGRWWLGLDLKIASEVIQEEKNYIQSHKPGAATKSVREDLSQEKAVFNFEKVIRSKFDDFHSTTFGRQGYVHGYDQQTWIDKFGNREHAVKRIYASVKIIDEDLGATLRGLDDLSKKTYRNAHINSTLLRHLETFIEEKLMGFICGLMTILGVSALVAGAGVSAAGVACCYACCCPCFKKALQCICISKGLGMKADQDPIARRTAIEYLLTRQYKKDEVKEVAEGMGINEDEIYKTKVQNIRLIATKIIHADQYGNCEKDKRYIKGLKKGTKRGG